MMFQVRFILPFLVPLSSYIFSMFLVLPMPFPCSDGVMVSFVSAFFSFSFLLRFFFLSSFSMFLFKPRRILRNGGRVDSVPSFSAGFSSLTVPFSGPSTRWVRDAKDTRVVENPRMPSPLVPGSASCRMGRADPTLPRTRWAQTGGGRGGGQQRHYPVGAPNLRVGG